MHPWQALVLGLVEGVTEYLPISSTGHLILAERALGIGFCQALALVPGTSRSLATIGGALLLGLSSAAAVEFSMLLGVVTLLAATAHEAHAAGSAMLDEFGPENLAIGFAAAFVSA